MGYTTREMLYEDIKNTTNVIQEDELRDIIFNITRVGAEMVVNTLGPFGKTVLVDDGGGFIYPTKDGWATLRGLRFNDPVYNRLYTTIRKTSFNVANRVGDGTTTMFEGAYYFLKEVIKYLEEYEGANSQIEFIDSVKEVKEAIIRELQTGGEVIEIDRDGTFEDIRQVAHISSNGNVPLSLIIQDIYQQTKNPTINFRLDSGDILDYDIIKGYVYECKPFRFKAYVNMSDGTYKKTTPVRTIFFDHNLSYQEHGHLIESISKLCNARNEEVIIYAPYFDDIISTIFNTTIDTYVQSNKVPNIMLVQVPMSAEYHSTYYYDLSVLCNAQIFGYGKVRAFNALIYNATHEEKIEDALLNVEGMNFESTQDIIMSCLGTMNKVTFRSDELLLEDYESIAPKRGYDTLVSDAKETYEMERERSIKANNMLRREFMNAQSRYVKLLGHMGVIKVGADSDEEKKSLFDSVEDAVLACKSAFESGYVRGMNMALLGSINSIKETNPSEWDADGMQADVLNIFDGVFRQVATAILENRYGKGAAQHVVIMENGEEDALSNCDIISHAIREKLSFNLAGDINETDPSRRRYGIFRTREQGYDVINPANTDIQVMECMVSILTMLITSGQFVSADRMYDKNGVEKRTLDESDRIRRREAAAKTQGVLDVLIEHPKTLAVLLEGLK